MTREGRSWCSCAVLAAALSARALTGLASPLSSRGADLVIDAAPGSFQKPYAPADGAVVTVTPPAFVWVPAAREASYVVQVSPTGRFEAARTRTWDAGPRTAFVPPAALAPGRWFWRYGVRSAPSVVWSRARAFTVARRAQPFPAPDIGSLLCRVPACRPRLFFPGVRLHEARHAARTRWSGEIAALVQECRRAVGEPLVAEPGRRPLGPERGRWERDVIRATRPPMDRMEQCALAYLLTGERALGLEARRRLLHFFSWDPDGPTSLFSYDEPALWMMMRGVRAYDWTRDLFATDERAFVESRMRVRAHQFARLLERRPFESDPFESHAGRVPGLLGECALAFAHEWPEAREWLRYVILIYQAVYPAWGGDDGGWHEGPAYWASYMRYALHFVGALRAATGFDIGRKPFFRNTGFYALATAPPYHEQGPFGDGHESPPRGGADVLFALSSVARSPELRWHADTLGAAPGRGLLTMVFERGAPRARPPAGLPLVRAFPSVGLVSMHTALGDPHRDVHLLFRCSPYGSVSHGHANQNAFHLEAYGEALAATSGCYPWYGSPHHHHWTRATRASNTVLVNGEGQVRRSADAAGELRRVLARSGCAYAEGEASRAYGGRLDRFTRRIVFLPYGTTVVCDDLAAPAPATFQWLLHALAPFEIDEQHGRVTVARAHARLDALVVAPAKVRLSQTDRYEPEPEAPGWRPMWHLTAANEVPSRSVRFVVALAPHRTEARAPVLVALPNGVRVAERWTVSFSARGARVQDDGRTVLDVR